jgi:hypothetical protein
MHGGPSIRLFEVSFFRYSRGSLPILFVFVHFLTPLSSASLTVVDRRWRAGLGQGTTASLD